MNALPFDVSFLILVAMGGMILLTDSAIALVDLPGFVEMFN